MTKNVLLKALKEFTEEVEKDLILEERMQKGDTEQGYSSPTVYLMRLPNGTSATKKAPYIIHQIITGHDLQKEGERTKSTTQVRSIFCIYCDDGQEDSMMLLEAMERLRIAMLKAISLEEQFTLDREAGIESLIYPDDTAPYDLGEMISTWKLPSVEREVRLIYG